MVGEMPEDLSEYYENEDYFNPDGETVTGYHENYDLLSPFFLYWQGALVNEIVRQTVKDSLLEVGCATGNALEMVRLFDKNIKLTGIDLSPYAIQVCREKGLNAEVSKIDDYKAKSKLGIVLSSETMEHVDKVRVFVDGISNNLEKDGVYAFFVPAVDRDNLIKQGKKYPSLTTSLEHISYFTKPFLQKALAEAMGGAVYVHQISNGIDNYFLGFVSSDKKVVAHMEKYAKAIEVYDKTITDAGTLFNLTVTSAKFAYPAIADKYFENYKKVGDEQGKLFLEGVLSYHKGELLKSKDYFAQYLGEKPADNFVLKVFLSIERQLAKILFSDIEKLSENQRDLEARIFRAEQEVNGLKNSKVVGPAIKLRDSLRVVAKPVRSQKKN